MPQTGHMHCKKCGYHISDGTRTCPLCGGEIVPEDKRNSVGEGFDHDLFDAQQTDYYSDKNDMYYGDKGLIKEEGKGKAADYMRRLDSEAAYHSTPNPSQKAQNFDFNRYRGTKGTGSLTWIIIIGIILMLSVSGSFFEELMDNKENNADYATAPAESVPASAEIATPFKEYSSIEDAKAARGYDFAVPSALSEKYTFLTALIYNDIDMADLIFTDDNEQINYRVSKTMTQDELNGDYNSYPVEYVMGVNGVDVTMLAKKDNENYVAMWTNDGFSYCVMADDGLDDDEVMLIAAQTIGEAGDGVMAMSMYPTEPKAPDYDISVLDDDKQQLYTVAYNYMIELSFGNGFMPNSVTVDGTYHVDNGFINMDAYENALESVFTDDYLDALEKSEMLSGAYPVHKDINGQFCTADGGRGANISYQGAALTINSQTDTQISMTLTATYNNSEFTSAYGKKDPTKDTTEDYPITLVKTNDGWRFSQFSVVV